MNTRIVLIAAICISLMACENSHDGSTQDPPGHTESPGDAMKTGLILTEAQYRNANIRIGTLVRQRIRRRITTPGVVDVPPHETAFVHAPMAGFVTPDPHIEGDYVRKGERLAIVSDQEIIHLQRQYLEAVARMQFDRKELDRQHTLASSEAGARRELERAEKAWKESLTAVNSLVAELRFVGLDTNRIRPEVPLSPSITVRAPVAGYLNTVNVKNGQRVTPQTVMYEILNKQHMHLELEVYARDLKDVKIGQRVRATLPGRDKIWEAEVYQMSQGIDEDKNTILVHGHFLSETEDLRPGMYLQSMIESLTDSLLTIDEGAIVRSGDMSFVFIKEGDAFVRQQVETGMREDGVVEIKGWSRPLQTPVVINGAYYLNSMTGELEHDH